MSSIIQYCKANNIQITLSSSKPESDNEPYKAFSTVEDYFATHGSSCYWQVSFPQKVNVSGYQFGGNSGWQLYATKWEVSYSNDNKSFIHVQNDSRGSCDSPEEIYPFPINPPISCKHFKITAKESNTDVMFLIFNKFDLFGSAGIAKNTKKVRCSCHNYRSNFHEILLI